MAIKVFWPEDVPIDFETVVYGWKLADDWYVVAGIASCFSSLDSVIASSEGLETLTDLQSSNVVAMNHQYIIYKSPNTDRLRFYSLQPSNPQSAGKAMGNRSVYSSSQKMQELYDRYDRPVQSENSTNSHYDYLGRTIALINTTHYVRTGSSTRQKTLAPKSSPTEGGENKLATTPAAVSSAVAGVEIAPLKMVSLSLLSACKNRVLALALSSAMSRQVLRRLREMSHFSTEWTAIRSGDTGLEEKSRRYISFYNTVWLIANDLIIGWTISSILSEQSVTLENTANQAFQRLFMWNIMDGLRWLDDWPVGLKLNTPLSRLFCETYIGMANIWPMTISRTLITTEFILFFIRYASFLGASMFLSALSDIIGLATLHVRLATYVSGAIYRAETIALYSLWNLFRGKRWNTLRNRVDSYDYGIDQLFLGTLLFTIALFLLPTIATYYLFFATIHLALLYVQGTNDTALSFINSFPLFALMLRLKEPSRLPGGVSMQLISRSEAPHIQLQLISIPIGADLIFAKFVTDWHQLSIGYSPQVLLKRLVSGKL
ncbi:hypothetical protein NliqN6_1852 [Naganishia liquefaciens]|uniref:Gpi1-domain-containing protein n=1 Tax=Naganishia liquefaciens TaxID=104408 RepID=A0A8H3YDH7_9TREE|nr:hypothetical protein NliqN6_1852 [Naganishia liquefaciens]